MLSGPTILLKITFTLTIFNLCILVGKQLIYQNRGKGNLYSITHFEILMEIEREAEEIFAIQNDKIELYEYKWEKYITKHQL